MRSHHPGLAEMDHLKLSSRLLKLIHCNWIGLLESTLVCSGDSVAQPHLAPLPQGIVQANSEETKQTSSRTVITISRAHDEGTASQEARSR